MQEIIPEEELAALLAEYNARGGVLDYVLLDPLTEAPPDQLHRAAALAGMAAIDRRLEQWAVSHASKEIPVEMFFRVRWDETKLTGEQVSFWKFWGADDVEPKRLSKNTWSIPNVDGYKAAFFHPPHGLGGSEHAKAELFSRINRYVLGSDRERGEIFSWSADWSNYFEAGHEWWGAFYWTIRSANSRRLVVVGASTTD